MACPTCAPTSQGICTTVFPTFSPCVCDEPVGIQEEGPTGPTGPGGETTNLSVGSVASGPASITDSSPSYAQAIYNFVLPAVPDGVPYTWSEINTFEQKPVFENGLTTTGGTSEITGGTVEVTSAATFDAAVDIAADTVANDNITVTTNLQDDGPLTVEGDTTLAALAVNQDISFGPNASIVLASTSELIAGALVLDECLRPKLVPYKGSNTYTKGAATGLLTIAPVDVGPICNAISFTVAASVCAPQVTPKIKLMIRVAWRMGGTPQAAFTAYLWQTSVGGTLVDVYSQGSTFNGKCGDFILRTEASLVLGVNNFYIEVSNSDVTESWIPTEITAWFEN